MILGRAFEDMCAQMYFRGKMFGYVHLYNGQEAVSTGFIKLLKKEDSVVSTYRGHMHALSKGVPARAVMSELFGKTTRCCRGQGGSMHMFSREHNLLGGFSFIGEGIPVATGAAFTSKYRREVLKEADCDHVTLAFFGDGTCNNGQFFECLNMAAIWKLPIVFVVQNNLWAMAMSHLRATSDPQIYKKGPAFGMLGIHVDGMDVLKVREVAQTAIARARSGEGPTLVECETYMFREHSLTGPEELCDPAEKAHYAARDPIAALKRYLIENNPASETELKAIDKKIEELVEDAVEFADESPHPPRNQLLENVFADPKGFGIGPDGRYRCEDPKFMEGTAQCKKRGIERGPGGGGETPGDPSFGEGIISPIFESALPLASCQFPKKFTKYLTSADEAHDRDVSIHWQPYFSLESLLSEEPLQSSLDLIAGQSSSHHAEMEKGRQVKELKGQGRLP
ncbi:hypothetical protein SLEP1_g24233 [Rubroshorea leprosula]|uniref:Pyruvate dehydrogenase E1 component subunit alpha n=1 Tax=Rubroshorea leprosula TaxID=152421 RepID=A0AAV5JEY9_9ROSI|nr:hypothetical protein SLEP1_g24233 [Rubroshorea leprosula]